MTDSGTPPDSAALIPPPRIGAGSADLVTDSSDTAELRNLLARARERLAFYESFDRIIGENIKRSGELMLETIQLREQADVNAREAAAAKAAFDDRLSAERKRHHDLLDELSSEVDQLHGQLDTFRTKLQATIGAIDVAAPANAAPLPEVQAQAIATESGGVPITPVESTPSTAPPAKPVKDTRTIDALFHGIPDPGTALQLQRHLNEVDAVTSVEAREFAEGILRLQVSASRPLRGTDFQSWQGSRPIRILREQSNVIEATLSDI